MDSLSLRSLGRAIAAHPRASLQDALLLFSLLIAALLLALQYNLFFFIGKLSLAQGRMSLAEAIFLTVLLIACLFSFTVRRFRDVRQDTALKAAAEVELNELTALALRDPLTGLYNRRALMNALSTAIKTLPNDGTQHALFLIDLNGFKRVNDTHGHAVGDQVLEIVADRFRAASRPSDIVARIGGDELAVLAYDVDREAAYSIGMRFVDALRPSIRAGKHSHSVSMAIGVALIPEYGATAEDALRNADTAMYRAKALDRSLVYFEQPTDNRQIA